MDVTGAQPLRTGSRIWQPRAGAFVLTVVCKLTYVLAPGQAEIAEDQDDVNEHDQHWNDDPTRSLYATSDLAPRKPRADVTLVGNAFAPGGEPVRSLVARLAVASVDKEIEIFGERAFSREGALREGARFARMPIRYERAAGGPGTANPVGVRTGRAAQPDAAGAVTLPNLHPAGATPTTRGDAVEPIGFGPLPAWFPARRDRLGRHAMSWTEARLPDEPIPDGLDLGYFNAAPPDQQPATLHEGERIVLLNLHREHPRFATSLPGARPRAFLERDGGAAGEVALRCDALWIDTDRAVCALTWRGEVALSARDERGRVIAGLERRGERLRYEDLLAALGPGPRPAASPARPRPITVPMTAAAAQRPAPIIELGPEDVEQAGPSTKGGPLVAAAPGAFVTTARVAAFQPGEPLPFVRGPSPPAAPPPPEEPRRPRVTTLVDPKRVGPVPTGPAWMQATGAPRASLEARPTLAPVLPGAPAFAPRETIDLLFHDRTAARRIRAAFLDPGAAPPSVRPEAESEAERLEADVARVLATAARSTAVGIAAAMASAVGGSSRFRAPLLVLAGELRFVFDEIEALRATVSAAIPFAAGDARLRDAIAGAREMLTSSFLAPASSVIEALGQRVREAFAQGRPPAYLAETAARALLERRAYQRRAVLGDDRICALLTLPGADTPFTTYLPGDVVNVLPMFPAIEARLLVEAHVAQDAADAHPVVLKALAIGRVMPSLKRG